MWLCSASIFFFKVKTAYEMRISDWSSDVCSSDLAAGGLSAAALTARGLPAYAEAGGNEAEKAQNVVNGAENALAEMLGKPEGVPKIGRATCRERVCTYV